MGVKEARERLEKLEKNPKHTTRNAQSDKETRTVDLSDPSIQTQGEQDKKWHKDSQGNWHHPDFE